MNYDFTQKSTVAQIRATFDRAVERFSSLQVGQQSAMDSVLILEMLTAAAARTTPHARHVLDIGCGAGNYTLKLLEQLPHLDCTLLDLSRPMLDRAKTRVGEQTNGHVVTMQGDIRAVELPEEHFDIVLTGLALHHLRHDLEWEQVFATVFKSLKPGGSFWISDLIAHEHPELHHIMRDRYGYYLIEQGGISLQERVFESIEQEDTPRSVWYQINLLHQTGFVNIDIVHKNACFAAFGAMKR
jgi:tRNA (cmo5U34)-methyltransferase